MEIEISEEAWPDIVLGVKAIKIVLDKPLSGIPSNLSDSTTAVTSSSPGGVHRDPIISDTLQQSPPQAHELPSPPTQTRQSTDREHSSLTSRFRTDGRLQAIQRRLTLIVTHFGKTID